MPGMASTGERKYPHVDELPFWQKLRVYFAGAGALIEYEERRDKAILVDALKAAEPYLYHAPLEGAIDVHDKVVRALREVGE